MKSNDASAGLRRAVARAPADSLQRGLDFVRRKTAEAVARAETPKDDGEADRDPDPVKLPAWPAATRGVPNVALRSSLFGAIAKGARRYLERQAIHALDGISIFYTGARLDQGDLDVWETVLHLVRPHVLANECRVTGYELLKALGKTDTGKNRATLDRRLSRMKATGVDVKVGRFSYEGSLIDEVYREEGSRAYRIRLNPNLMALFEPDQFTFIEWAVRHALDGKPLGQWPHGYYASHARPFPMKVETLLKLSGSENENPRSSHQKLRKALDAVVVASRSHGEEFSYQIRGELVCVEKSAGTRGNLRRNISKRL